MPTAVEFKFSQFLRISSCSVCVPVHNQAADLKKKKFNNAMQ